jgi:hypothetical protein
MLLLFEVKNTDSVAGMLESEVEDLTTPESCWPTIHFFNSNHDIYQLFHQANEV